jgi:hypothetical protein
MSDMRFLAALDSIERDRVPVRPPWAPDAPLVRPGSYPIGISVGSGAFGWVSPRGRLEPQQRRRDVP